MHGSCPGKCTKSVININVLKETTLLGSFLTHSSDHLGTVVNKFREKFKFAEIFQRVLDVQDPRERTDERVNPDVCTFFFELEYEN